MKKKLLTIAALTGIMALSLIACGSSKNASTKEDTKETNDSLAATENNVPEETLSGAPKKLSLEGFKTYIETNGMASDPTIEMYEFIGASDGFGFENPEFSVYSYDDLENSNYLSALNNGYIELAGSKSSVIVNNNLVLYYEDEAASADIITAFKNFSEQAVTEQSNKSTDNVSDISLNEIDSWLIGDIWNDGFCDISYYIKDGTSSTGSSLDIEFSISQLQKKMELKSDYDNFISNCEYQSIKDIWSKLSPEIDRLYNIITTNTITANCNIDFDTDLFVQYRDAFSDEVYSLE